jgi:uncharacterized OB-fold protein
MSEARAARVPIEAGFFTIPGDPAQPPRLLASRCRACGETFFPRRQLCCACFSRDLEATEIGPRGTLYTYTYVRVPMFNRKSSGQGDPGYGVGQVDLPEGPRVQAVLSGAFEDFRIGMEMELELEALRENEQGQEAVIFRFRPVAAAGADRGAAR